jgi:hypothetical protein
MPIPTPNIAVYTEGLVLTPAAKAYLKKWVDTLPAGPPKDMLAADLEKAIPAADVAKAGFDCILVGLWHVHKGGAIYYNDFPINDNTRAAFTGSFKELKSAPGSTVKNVIISVGGGDGVSDDDYTNMKAAWSTVGPALRQLFADSNADGVDWDYEPVSTQFDSDFIITITNQMASPAPPAKAYRVTAAPFEDIEEWKKVISNTLFQGGTLPGNNFAWWNLQIYGGADYKDWIDGLGEIKTGLKPLELQAFLVPGYSMSDCDSPPPIKEISDLRKTYTSLRGAFIWNYDGIQGCAQDVASKIRKVFSP